MTKVFISHQKEDRKESAIIAEYFKKYGIGVYFDEFDKELQIATQNNNPSAVVNAIKNGINNSTHMLCIISPNTLKSKWVPFEVGYGYDRTKLATLTLSGISNSELPDYIKIAQVIRDIYDIDKYIKEHGNQLLLENKSFSSFDSPLHPLRSVMDSFIKK